MAQGCVVADLSVDDCYLSALFDDPQIIPISDSKYAEELQLQEALVSSSSNPNPNPNPLLFTGSASASASISTLKPLDVVTIDPHSPHAVVAAQLCDCGTSQTFCEICAERKDPEEMFPIQACSHAVCSLCIAKHVTFKVLEGASPSVTCPGLACPAALDPAACRSVLPPAVTDRWEASLCESLFPEAHKFYCPYPDCSALLLNDPQQEEAPIVESECPVCRRLFCAQCRVPWHSTVGCQEFQRLNEDERERGDLLLRELAKGNSWNRCPFCKHYVEKTEGCLHITCRCGHEFCYACGSQWSSTHGGCDTMFPN